MSDASESASDSGDEAWDPSMATPVAETPLQAPRRGRRHAARVRPRATDTPERRDAGAPSGRAGSEESRGTSQGSGASGDSNPGATMVDPEARAAWELPVMDGINRERQLRGQSPVKKLTVRVLRENLTGRIIHGKGEGGEGASTAEHRPRGPALGSLSRCRARSALLVMRGWLVVSVDRCDGGG